MPCRDSDCQLSAETHGGEDVPVFARGPGADAVRGSLEQNSLLHIIANALTPPRRQLCRLGSCNADEVSIDLPDYRRLPARRTR